MSKAGNKHAIVPFQMTRKMRTLCECHTRTCNVAKKIRVQMGLPFLCEILRKLCDVPKSGFAIKNECDDVPWRKLYEWSTWWMALRKKQEWWKKIKKTAQTTDWQKRIKSGWPTAHDPDNNTTRILSTASFQHQFTLVAKHCLPSTPGRSSLESEKSFRTFKPNRLFTRSSQPTQAKFPEHTQKKTFPSHQGNIQIVRSRTVTRSSWLVLTSNKIFENLGRITPAFSRFLRRRNSLIHHNMANWIKVMRRNKNTTEEKYKFVTFILNKTKLSTEHRTKKKRHPEIWNPQVVQCTLVAKPTVQLCGDIYVTWKKDQRRIWPKDKFFLKKKTTGTIQKIPHCITKQISILTTSWIITTDQEADHWANIGA